MDPSGGWRAIEAVVEQTLSDANDPVTVVNPTESVMRAVVDTASEIAAPPIQILAEPQELRAVMEDFLIASRAADLLAADQLFLRVTESPPRTIAFVEESRVVALVSIEDAVVDVQATERERIETVVRAVANRWAMAESFRVDAPPRSKMMDALEEVVGEAVRADFQAMLDALDSVRGNGKGVDEVSLSLLAAANNDALLYDISKWGEAESVASKATFSRAKNRLEDLGLIETEKVPIDVGRPRLRLTLPEDGLENPDPERIATVAEGAFST